MKSNNEPLHPKLNELSWKQRTDNLERMSERELDLLIIGGGVNGAWMALDGAMRGLRVGVVEKNDFGHGPSRNNSELLHGGFRYLKEWYQEPRNWPKVHSVLHLVRGALREREVLMRIAPHLARPMAFCMPLYARPGLGWATLGFYGMGFWMYDRLSAAQIIKPFKMLSRTETLNTIQGVKVENLVGAGLYYDCKMEPSRLLAEIIKAGAAYGALHANYVEAIEPLWSKAGDGVGRRIEGLQCQDIFAQRSYEIRAREIIDATGPWGDVFRRRLWPDKKPSLRLSKGIHVMVPQTFSPPVACAFFTDDNRIIFVVPWGETYNYSLIGTTDTDYTKGPDEVAPDQKSVDYLVSKVKALFPKANLDFQGYYAGVRPLIRQEGGRPSSVSREHTIERQGDSHVTSVFGGKWTTARQVAAEALDKVFPATNGTSRTHLLRFGGADVADLFVEFKPTPDVSLTAQAQDIGLKRETIEHLIFNYGRNAGIVLQIIRDHAPLKEPILPDLPFLKAEVVHAVRFEMAMRVADFLIRRRLLGRLRERGLKAAPVVAEIMAKELGWNAERVRSEIDYYTFSTRLDSQ